jgi:hypothetical protein
MISIGLLLAGCGGGGGSDTAQGTTVVPPSGSLSVLAWNPPANYADNTTLDPYRDLDHYEVYVRNDAGFTESDLPVAVIAAVTEAPVSGGNTAAKVLDKEFILNNIESFINPGTIHYVSLRAVGVDGQKSDFMPAVLWDNS